MHYIVLRHFDAYIHTFIHTYILNTISAVKPIQDDLMESEHRKDSDIAEDDDDEEEDEEEETPRSLPG